MMAVIFRMIFITVGIVLVERFEWLLYLFGAFLVYTGIKMFSSHHEETVDIEKNIVYRFIKRILPLVPDDGGGKFTVRIDGKKYYTTIFVVVIMLASTDIVFALDSIPAVFGISTDRLVIYTSNTFAVLGLRSLFFLLKGAVNKFSHLQQGIAIVLIFIGLKMLLEELVSVPSYISLLVIIICLAGSIIYSIQVSKNNTDNKE